MTEETKTDYRNTVFLPKTDFPMKAGLPQKEPGILARWESEKLYHKLRAARAGREKFILHDGPPYANGDMHIGHALNHILKDLVVRTQSLTGKDAPYVPGWDCHGLPIEWKVEEQYRKKKLNKDEVPVKEFRAECRAYAQHWVNVQRDQLKRLGVNGDWDNPYLTMDFQAEATIVSELLKFAESGQLYRGSKPVMWSCVEKTALAEAEVEYEDITSTQIDVAFEMLSAPNCPAIQDLIDKGEKVHAVIWTTTPWTIPVNQALAYGAEVEYSVVKLKATCGSVENEFVTFVVAKALLRQFGDRLFRNHVERNGQGGWSLSVVETTHAPNWTDLPVATPSTDHMVSGQVYAYDTHYSDGACRFEVSGSQLAGATARHPMYNLLCSREGGSPVACNTDLTAELDSRLRGNTAGGGNTKMLDFFTRPRPFLDGSSFVTTDAGTGLVHMAPDHGEDDFALCKQYAPTLGTPELPLTPVFAVEGDGKYRTDWAWMGGQGPVVPYSPKGPDKLNLPDGPICSDLREAGALLSAAPFPHSYPHSWRSKAKLIYRCTPQWFVSMDKEIPRRPEPVEGLPFSSDVDKKDSPSTGSGLRTLRETAVAAIAATRFVPEKGRNRLGSMVEGRPDWVLSRQRAWGVPITLFVNRKTGAYLNDAEVNARIIAGVRAEGVDAWSDEAAQSFLGETYALADYERVTDILDVWFDSGCTHVFTLESGRWPDHHWPADLYLEGSDQHRGWFQSSLLESCGTRGRAPYNAVLTHGFTMDAKGMKMSKSLGNTINPLDLMRDYGADILRMWVASVDFTEDHRIGKEILSGVADQYRKLRNTFRYLLGALDGFVKDNEEVTYDEMPELERYVLHLLAELDGKLIQAVADFDFNTYLRLITDFANNDLSAFFFDIRKDALYCEVNPPSGYQTEKRRAYRTVLDILFHALVRYAAPVLVFTAEEVWATRFGPDAESVHLAEWPEVDAGWVDVGLASEWERVIRPSRSLVTQLVEKERRDKFLGSSLEAVIELFYNTHEGIKVNNKEEMDIIRRVDFEEVCIVSKINLKHASEYPDGWPEKEGGFGYIFAVAAIKHGIAGRTTHHKCGRCWRHLPEVTEDGALCGRCADVLSHG